MSTRINWPAWDKYLGAMPDTHLARRINCGTRAVISRRKKLGIPAYAPPGHPGPPGTYNWKKVDHLLGTMEDKKVAALMGCTRDAVWRRRRNLNIPAFRPKSGHKTRIDWEYWDQYLGTMPDLELSRRIGCTYMAVRNRRAWKDNDKNAKPKGGNHGK